MNLTEQTFPTIIGSNKARKNTFTFTIHSFILLIAAFFIANNGFSQALTFNTGSMQPGMEFTPAGTGTVQVADINGDGFPDIIYTTAVGGGVVYLQNNGSGSFSTPATNPFAAFTSSSPVGLTFNANTSIADFDGDGDLDIWCRVSGASNDVYLQNNNGTYVSTTVPSGMEFTPAGTGTVQVADINGDGYPDIIYTTSVGGPLVYLQNNGNGTYGTPATNPFAAFTASSPTGLTFNVSSSIADFDGDGDLDIWCRVSGAANDVYLQNNNGTYVTAVVPAGMEFTLPGTGTVQVADLNDDGYVDIIYNAGAGTGIVYLQNNGSGSFSTPALNPFAAYTSSSPAGLTFNAGCTIADFDGDGDFDIWCRVSGAANDVYLQAGGFAPKLNSSTPANNSSGISPSANIVLNFNEAVTVGSGNIYIRNYSNNSIVQTIAANSTNVTGSGTSIITINPPTDLAGTTAYYVTFDRHSFAAANGVIVGKMNAPNKVIDPISQNNFLHFTTSGVLSLQLISFDARLSGTVVQTSWKTANELEVFSFTVEKSRDGLSFAPATSISAKNNSFNDYQWMDPNIFNGTNYYRLKITNISGTITYSSIVKVRPGNALTGTKIYSNPSLTNTFTVQLPQTINNESYQLNVYNSAGQQVFKSDLESTRGSQAFTLSPVASGVYSIVLTNKNQQSIVTNIVLYK